MFLKIVNMVGLLPVSLYYYSMDLNSLEDKELLSRARMHIFSTGLGDAASRLCRENTVYGLAKIHLVQEEYGLEPSATFISTPDETVTRNLDRWMNGVGYGGKFSWGEGSDKIIFLDFKPNCCGALVGGIEDLPNPRSIIKSLYELESREHVIEGVPVEWDFNVGNHFIDIFRTAQGSSLTLPEYIFIIHSSAPELKGENPLGTGLYYNRSPSLQKIMKTVKTRFGEAKILVDSDAEEYYKFYKLAERFSEEKRILAAKEIFGDFKLISSKTHQGLLNFNEAVLGCHFITSKGGDLYSIALRPDLPAYLVEGKKSFSKNMLEALGFYKRAEELGVLKRLLSFNCLPHGGGYSFPDMVAVKEVISTHNQRYFVMELQNELGYKIFSNPGELQFIYRGRHVVVASIELELIELKAKLIPEYVLKI
ncbi:MAG: hypothetical protein OdinLCB4_006200 [Candidatus Odinarchaeum yellowstonii]|uniref:Uncharacterized protein n=1 Tax=Odinarchaeota yellowstonii (strain LCB_4) TaxID=1841599 RepID=A0AAF0IB47_ODILC|nr:MAG: hypothetical protein OdinLCB4_006200 [Candidatus Odinarchaeum yellowstonii]